jgi:hypothetical protein
MSKRARKAIDTAIALHDSEEARQLESAIHEAEQRRDRKG